MSDRKKGGTTGVASFLENFTSIVPDRTEPDTISSSDRLKQVAKVNFTQGFAVASLIWAFIRILGY